MPRLLRGLVGTAAGLGIIVLAAWLTLQWGILPRADLWRPRLAQWASQAIGMEVQITHIEVLGDLWAPTLRLDGVQLLGGHGYTKEHPVERWYRDLRAIGVAEGVVVL